MFRIILLFFGVFLIFHKNAYSQTNGGWGNCEFTTVAVMNTFDPSTSNYDCKKVFVQATNEHYHWDGVTWVLDAGVVENIYNKSDTLTGDRIVTLNGNDLTFDGTGTGDVFIDFNGNLGVGTTSPDAKLDVEGGTVRFSDYGNGTITGANNQVLTVDTNGDVLEMNTVKSSKIFYPPTMTIDASAIVSSQTLDLHQQYSIMYGTPAVGSTSAPASIPTYLEDELYYYLVDYDTAVLDNVLIDDDGIMTYDIVAVPADKCAIVTVIFVVK